MYFIYSLLLTLGFVVLLPRFVVDALRSGKYVTGLRQRLGNVPKINSGGKSVVWLHCVSVGEAQAAQSLVRALTSRFPNLALVISTTTVTGQQLARDIFRDQAQAVFYFPIDWAWTVRRVLRRVQPATILVMETELWPHLFREATRRKIPVALVNGRISDKSFGRYKMVRAFIRRALNHLRVAVMQSELDAARISELGMADDRISISGNLKFDSMSVSANDEVTDEIRHRFGFNDGRPLIVAASTHHPEESAVVDAFKLVRQTHSQTRLLIAPRHPERFDEVAALLLKSGLSLARRSAPTSAEDAGADVVLLDSIGELRGVYPLAEIAFVGGSIAPHGGHSVIEPAACGVCTITGPNMQNFAAVTQALLAEDALIQLSGANEPAAALARVIDELLSDDARRRGLGQRAMAVSNRNRGATARTLEVISNILAVAPAQPGNELRFSPLHAATAK